LCVRRPPLLIGGFFRCREERGPRALFLDCFRLFFPLFFIVSRRLLFSIAITRTYIVFSQTGAL